MGNVWDEKPSVSGNKVILSSAGDEFTGQVREKTQVYVDRFKKDVPAIVFEDGTEEGRLFEAGLTVWYNALLRIQPEPGEWLRVWRGGDKGSYTDGGVERVQAPEGGAPVTKSAPKEKPAETAKPKSAVNLDEPPF